MTTKSTITVALCALAAACGGGGSEPAAVPTPAPTAVASDGQAQAPAPAAQSPAASPTPAPTPAPAPVQQPAPAPVVVNVAPAPAPTTYTAEQWRIIGIIEAEIAKVTTHQLATDTQLPGWLKHFEDRLTWWPEYVWRQEMRKIAIQDGGRFSWQEAPTRSQYTDAGALISTLTCSYIPEQLPTQTRYWVDDEKVFINGYQSVDFSNPNPDQYTTITVLDQGSQFIVGVDQQYPSTSGAGRYTVAVPEGRVIKQSFASNSNRVDCQ